MSLSTAALIPLKNAQDSSGNDITSALIAQDNIWSQVFTDKDHITVTFEQKLAKHNDITLYPRVKSGNPSIQVYSDNMKVAEFNELTVDQLNTVFLRGLTYKQDTFTLHIIGGSVEFDYIVDPFIDNGSLIQDVYDCGVLNTTGAMYNQNMTITPIGNGPCINITAPNITFNGNGFSLRNTTFLNYTIYGRGYNTTVTDVNITMGTLGGSGVGAISLVESNRSRIANSNIHAGSTCILLLGSSSAVIENISTGGCTFRSIFYNDNSANMIIQNNNLTSALDIIQIEPFSGDNLTVRNNFIQGSILNRVNSARYINNTIMNVSSIIGGGLNAGGSNINITNNTIIASTPGFSAITEFGTYTNVIIEGNILRTSPGTGDTIRLTSPLGFTIIRNNTILGSPSGNGIGLVTKTSGSLIIANNIIQNSNLSGIALHGSFSGRIENNTILVSNFSGVSLNSSRNMTVQNNTIMNAWYGLIVESVGGTSGFSANNTFIAMQINASIQDAVMLRGNETGASVNNSFINITIANTNTSRYDLFVNSSGFNRTRLVNGYIANYSLGATGITMIFVKDNIGQIQFLQVINGSSINLSGEIDLRSNFAAVNATKPSLNKSANVTLIVTDITNPTVYRDGAPCPASICTLLSSISSSKVFNVSSWSSNYTLVTGTNITQCTELSTPNTVFTLGTSITSLSLSSPCILISASNITLQGNQFAINNSVVSTQAVRAANYTNITIMNISVTTGSWGILFEGTSNSLIDSISAVGNGNYGIYLTETSNVTVRNVMANHNANVGIFSSTTNGTILRNITTNNNSVGLTLYTGGNTSIENLTSLYNQVGLQVEDINAVTIRRAQVGSSGEYGIRISNTINVTINSSNFTNNTYNFVLQGTTPAQFTHQVSADTIFENDQHVYIGIGLSNYEANTTTTPNASSVYCVSCSNVEYKDLNLSNDYYGAYFINSTSLTLRNSTISETYGGIVLHSSSNNLLFNNNITSLSDEALDLTSESNTNNITNNTLYGTDGATIVSIDQSSNNVYSNNDIIYPIENSNGPIVSFSNGNNNTFIHNNITNYGDGRTMDLSESSNNTFQHNWIQTYGSGGGHHGVAIESDSLSNLFVNNSIISAGGDGLRIQTSENNIVINNTIIIYNVNSESQIAALDITFGAEGTQAINNYLEGQFINALKIEDVGNITVEGGVINNSGREEGQAIAVTGSLSSNVTLKNISVVNTNPTGYDLYISSVPILLLQDMVIGNYSLDFGDDTSLKIGSSNEGEITFIFGTLFNQAGINLSADVIIDYNYSFVNSSNAPWFDVHSNITFYNLPTNMENISIYKDGSPCGNECYNFTSLDAGNVTFNVTDWSYYNIVGNTVQGGGSTGTGSSGSGSSGSGSGGSGGSGGSSGGSGSVTTPTNPVSSVAIDLDDPLLSEGASVVITPNTTLTIQYQNERMVLSNPIINSTGVLFKTNNAHYPTIWVAGNGITSIDFNNDGVEDVQISLSQLNSGRATLTLKKTEIQTPEQPVTLEENLNVPWFFITVMGLVAIGAGVAGFRWYLQRKRLLGYR